MVLRTATRTPLGRMRPSSRDRRLPSSAGVEVESATPLMAGQSTGGSLLAERDLLARADPLVVCRVERAVRLDRRDRVVDALSERAVELQHGAHLVGLRRDAELTDDGRLRLWRVEVFELRVAHVESRLKVDDEPVDLVVLEQLQGDRI